VSVIGASIASIRDKKQLVIADKRCKEMRKMLWFFMKKIEK
jgi:hypothetical protein